MKLFKILRLGFIVFSLSLCLPLHAAVIHTVVNTTDGPKLTFAKGIQIDTDNDPNTAPDLFNVEFVDGTFSQVFPNGVPLFHDTQNEALKFASALDQVLVDTINYQFDSSPRLTNGCVTAVAAFDCLIFVPYSSDNSFFNFLFIANETVESNDFIGSFGLPLNFDTSVDPAFTFARFSAAAPVPEPQTYITMLCGLLILIAYTHRFKMKPVYLMN